MKKIWKKPGTIAWQNAMKKSAGRMALDIIRVPNEKLRKACDNYMGNKARNPEEAAIVERLVSKAIEKETRKIKGAKEQIAILSEQSRKILSGIANLDKRFGEFDSPKKLKIYRNSLQTILNNTLAHIKRIKVLEKSFPNKDTQKVKMTIQKTEKRCEHLAATIAIIEKEINDMEKWQ